MDAVIYPQPATPLFRKSYMVIRASRYILIPIEGRIVIVVSPCPVIWLYTYPVASSPIPSGSVRVGFGYSG